MKTKVLLAAAIAAIGMAGTAQAQRGPVSATLYELPNFEGRSVTITDAAPDLGDWRFNDRAQSARFRGTWRVCEHDDFRGRCQELRGEAPNLAQYGLTGQISSLAPAGFRRPGDGEGGGGLGGWAGGGRDQRGVEGARTVFFVRPTVRGLDLAAARSNAEQFCARQGLGRSVYFDSSERAQQALGPDGGIVSRTGVIRDLLCLKY